MEFAFLWLTSLSVMVSRFIHAIANSIPSFLFMTETVPHLLYPLICRWTFRLFPCLG